MQAACRQYASSVFEVDGNSIPANMQVFADANMLKSTTRNLAANAVKYTSKGGQIILAAKSAFGSFV
jgi:signal transduction histidine kinase